MADRPRWRRIVLVALALLFGVGYLLAFFFVNGRPVGRLISDTVNSSVQGRMEIGSVHWRPWALIDLLLGRPHGVYVRDFQIFTPDGKPSIIVPEATARIPLGSLLRGRLSIQDVRIAGREARVVFDVDPDRGFLSTWNSRDPSRPGGIPFHLDAKLEPITLELRVGSSVSLVIPSAKTPLELNLVGEPGPRVQLAPVAERATLRIQGDSYALSHLEVTRLGAAVPEHPDDLAIEVRAIAEPGAQISASGALRDVFAEGKPVRLDVELTARNMAGLLAAHAGPYLPQGVILGGPQAQARVQLRGPARAFVLTLDSQGLEFSDPVRGVALKEVGGHLELDTGSGLVRATTLKARLGRGEVVLVGTFDPGKGVVRSRLKLRSIALGPLLPPAERATFAGLLSGTASVDGSRLLSTSPRFSFSAVDLTLSRSGGRGSLPDVRVLGGATLEGTRLQTQDLRVETRGARADAKGWVDLKAKLLHLAVHVAVPELKSLLIDLGQPAAVASLASSLEAQGELGGSFSRPRFEGTSSIGDFGLAGLRIPQVAAQLALIEQTLRLSSLHGIGPAGSLSGTALLDLAASRGQGDLTLRGLDLSKIDPRLEGKADVDGKLGGTFAQPTGRLSLKAPNFTIRGDLYAALVQADLDAQGVHISNLDLMRKAGGTFSGHGTVDFQKHLNFELDASKYPIGRLPLLPRLDPLVTGTLSGHLQVTGLLSDPRPAGHVEIQNARVRGIQLGNGRLDLVPGGDALFLRGDFFNRFALRGYLNLVPDFSLTVTLSFRDLPIEQMVPELEQFAEVRGTVTGQIDLSFSQAGGTHIEARLEQVRLSAQGFEEDNRPRRVEVANVGQIRIVYDGGRLRFDAFRLQSDHGTLDIAGYLDSGASNLSVRGDVDLELLEYFTRSIFKHTHGTALANLVVTGPMLRPQVAGTLDLNKIVLTPQGFDAPIAIPSGHATFTHTGVSLENLLIRMGPATTSARGQLDWKDWNRPTGHLELSGRLPARLFPLLFTGVVVSGHGMMDIDLKVDGPIRSPGIKGGLRVVAPGLTLEIRGYGRQVRILDADVAFSEADVAVRSFKGKIDDGDISLSGNFQLVDLRPRNIRLRMQASELPFRDPGILLLTLAADLELRGNLDDLTLGGPGDSPGSVDIVDGRYIQQFDSPIKSAVLRPRTREEQAPFWTGIPALENMSLNVEVYSRGQLMIDNNLARQVRLETALVVGGTVADPEIGGQIRVLEGYFTVPLLRGTDFVAVPGGSITFYPYKRFPDTPELNIEAEKSYTDSTDQDHLVRLKFIGPLGEPIWSLETNTGLNTAQTLVLLTTGRPPTELRSAFRGDTKGAGGASDQLAKELSAGALQEIISDPLNRILGLDALSIYVGPESVDVRARKRLVARPRLDLLGLQSIGILNRSYFEGKVELKLHDNISLDGELQRFSRGTETEQESLDRGKGQIKFQFRLR